jgi:signal transduction histidine kinase
VRGVAPRRLSSDWVAGQKEVAAPADSADRGAANGTDRKRQLLEPTAVTDSGVGWILDCKIAVFESRGTRVGVRATVTKAGERIAERGGQMARPRQTVVAEHDLVDRRDAVGAALGRLNGLLQIQSSRIAGVLHDDVSQVLAAAHMTIEEIAGDAPEAAQARLRQVRAHLHDVAEQLRRISHELHPSILDDFDVTDAITLAARAFTRRTGVHVTTDLLLDERCPATVDAVLYRIVEEALTNIDTHARAASAAIAIAREGPQLFCTVSDDGVGFDVAALARHTNRGLGLMLLRGRLEAIGGTLDITSAPQQGTRLSAVIPVEI